MVDILVSKDAADVSFNLTVRGGVPIWFILGSGTEWATACREVTLTKLDYRNVVEPGTDNRMFVLFEPPRIEKSLLAMDPCPMVARFYEGLRTSGGLWSLILQWTEGDGKYSRAYMVEDDCSVRAVEYADGSTIREGWYWELA